MKPLSGSSKKPLGITAMLILILLLQIKAFSQSAANFSASIVSGCSPILVSFTDQSSGNPTEWKWDLGNGTYSNLQHPSVTYFAPGKYTVKLVIKTGASKDSVIKTNYITVYESAVVQFNADLVNGCNPLTVNFTDQTTTVNGISSWQWDLGDGILSNLRHPVHTYTLPGSYSVTLKIITADGCASTVRKSGYIHNNTVKAKFTSSTPNRCLPTAVQFQNASTGNGSIRYNWNFGDGNTSSLENPAHTYTAGGVYNVKLTTLTQYGCTDTFSTSLTIQNPVTASFSGDQLNFCSTPAAVQFTSGQQPGYTYTWEFGDISTSSVANPLHIYSDTGIYTVRLTVKNSNGCIDSLTRTNYISTLKPLVSFNGLPDSGCVAFSKSFSASSNSSQNISNYLWNFGDGSFSTQAAPVHSFNNSGYYDVTLIATSSSGCSDTVFMPAAIGVNTKPTADFSADMRYGCAGMVITFSDHSSGGVKSWLWAFGDNSFSTDSSTVHTYKDTGWMDVQLMAMNGGCTDVKTLQQYIYLKPAVAKFAVLTDCAEKYKRTFSNFSIGADHWFWNFGDGTTSEDYSPVHYFTEPGVYYVKLVVSNDSTGCEYSLTKRVKVLDINAGFGSSHTLICKDTKMKFYSMAHNPDILRYYWEFGDGTWSISLNDTITHAYKTAGNYTVRLAFADSLNCIDTLSQFINIKVVGPTAFFGLPQKNTCANTPLFFTDSSTHDPLYPIKKWMWSYGDGKKDTLNAAPFTHSYNSAGFFRVALKVIDSMGCTDSISLTKTLQINKLVSTFYLSDTLICPGYAVKFVCPYADNNITYKWDFGDGGTGNAQINYHSYLTEGVYTVKLLLTSSTGCRDSSMIMAAVRVKKTSAVFEMSDSFRTCPPLLIQFTNHSTGASGSYWNFGDSSYTNSSNPSHFYTYPGEYTASLIVKGPGACADTLKRKITVKGPKGNIAYTPRNLCRPYQVDFTAHTQDAVSYIWDFNDGVTIAGADTALRYTYRDSGNFVPKIILIDDIGCRVPVTGRDTINNIFVTPLFKFPDSTLCNSGTVSFNNSTLSNESIASYHWDFGDNTSGQQINPVHQYANTGIYYPALSVTTNTGCTGRFRSAVPVKIAHAPNISIVSSGNGCAPLNVNLNAVLATADTSRVNWLWKINNQNAGVLPNPPEQVFANAAVYTISLIASSSNGCTTTTQKTIEAFARPPVQITGAHSICQGQETILTVTGAATYKWLQAASLNCDSCATVTAKPSSNQGYKVTGKSLQGCSSADSFTIAVKQPFIMTYSGPASICKGQNNRLEATGATTYQWSPAHGLNSTSTANPTARPDSTTSYRVIGTDDAGCFKDTGYIKLTVYSNPTVKAGPDKTISAGTPLDLEAIYSSDVSEVRWSPTADIFRAGTNIITVKPSQNTEYTIDVKNPGGCSASDRVNVIVKFDGSNVFIPNLFSPNNDGVNDIFYPRGKGVFKVKRMAIFSRWGELVFEKTNFNSNDPSAGWDGTFRGGRLMPDIFVYIVDMIGENGTVLPIQGNIALTR